MNAIRAASDVPLPSEVFQELKKSGFPTQHLDEAQFFISAFFARVSANDCALHAPATWATLIAGLLVELFEARFDPQREDPGKTVLEGARKRLRRELEILLPAEVAKAHPAFVEDLLNARGQTRDAQMQAINSKNGSTSVTKKSYYNFSRVGKPEKITTDTAPLGSFNTGDCFEDSNGNGSYDSSAGSTGLGGADDIVFYQVTVSMPRLFPMAKLLGWSATQTATANATIRPSAVWSAGRQRGRRPPPSAAASPSLVAALRAMAFSSARAVISQYDISQPRCASSRSISPMTKLAKLSAMP